MTVKSKTSDGNFFENFSVGQEFTHAIPRTVTVGDVAVYNALYGSRFVFNCSDPFARSLGLEGAPLDDLFVLHYIAGKSVTDISLNAVANLGYAGLRYRAPVYPGDTLRSTSRVTGLRQNKSGESGIVYLETTGLNQRDEVVLEFARWVMVNKNDTALPGPETVIPTLPDYVPPDSLDLPPGLDTKAYDVAQAGGGHLWEDYVAGERIDHIDGATIEEAKHMLGTRLSQNTARVHLDDFSAKKSRWGRRLVFGPHIMSTARALSHNGLANAFKIAAINAVHHPAPAFAGYTIFAWSEVLETVELAGRSDLGAMRLRTIATNDHPCADFPGAADARTKHPDVVLDFDYWALVPRRGAGVARR